MIQCILYDGGFAQQTQIDILFVVFHTVKKHVLFVETKVKKGK